MTNLARRRFLAITAAMGAVALLPRRARHDGGGDKGERGDQAAIRWNGYAMGAEASLALYHPDRRAGEALVEAVVAEVQRLEGLFSLYRADSELSLLNQRGFLIAPSAEMLAILAESRAIHAATGGAFNPTVQPLWLACRDAFGKEGRPPTRAELQRALAAVGLPRVLASAARIELPPGGALTLNGIAQGYATDRVVQLLRRAGLRHALVNMGETRALGTNADGAPWTIGIASPDDSARIAQKLAIDNRAVATSSQTGFHFDEAGRYGHILDPRSGAAPRRWQSVTVVAPEAATADALSTAFTLMERPAIEALLARQPGVEAHVLAADGVWWHA